MMKNNFKSAWLFLVFLALISCRTEETILTQNTLTPIQNKKYSNKSLWKEDEVFIKNVIKIYEKNADENKMQARYGKIYWDYATSLNTFDESYLIAPILKDDKVSSYVEVRRIGNRVFFGFTEDDKKTNDFFSTLIFTERENLKAVENPTTNENENIKTENGISYSTQSVTIRTLQCKTVTKTLVVGYVEGGGPNQGGEISETYTQTVCKFVDTAVPQDTCIGEVDAQGNCSGGGGNGGGGGYNYTNPEEEEHEDECEKVSNIISNLDFKEKYNQLNTTTNFNADHEVGFFEKNGEFFPANSDACSYVLKATTSVQCITGVMHVHPTKNCDGYYNDRTPSWGDIMVFLQVPVVQAKNCTGSATNAYHVTITATGNYMIKYNKDIPPTNNNYNFEAGHDWYQNALQDLVKNEQYTQQNIESLFMEFMDTYANIDGLEVYKLEDNNVSKLTYNSTTKTANLLPCP